MRAREGARDGAQRARRGAGEKAGPVRARCYPREENADPKQQQQLQQQDQEQDRVFRCVHVRDELDTARGLDPMSRTGRDDEPLQADLDAIGVHLSPLIVYKPTVPLPTLERAFFVTKTGIVGLCALVELWATRPARRDADLVYDAYTRDGKPVRAPKHNATPGEVLFGRYLCGSKLSEEEQREFLAYLNKRYDAERATVHRVISCLVSAGVLPAHTGWLRQLAERATWDVTTVPKDIAFVREVLGVADRTGRTGRTDRTDRTDRKVAKASFGRRYI